MVSKLLHLSVGILLIIVAILAIRSTHTVSAQTPTPIACTIHFSDVQPGHTFYTPILCLACKNIVTGYDDGTFRPDENLTRGQISKIVSEAAHYTDDPGAQIFEDVPVGHTFYNYINRLSRRNIVTGYVCGSRPDAPCVAPLNRPYYIPGASVSKGQAAKIVALAGNLNENPGPQIYQDVPPGSTFYDYINRMNMHSAVTQTSCNPNLTPTPSVTPGPGYLLCVPPNNQPYYLPGNSITRGEVAKMVQKIFFPGCQVAIPTPTGPTSTPPASTPTTPATPTPNCHLRPIGDADCNGAVDYEDYFYYLRAVSGGALPTGVSPDFNGDGHVDHTGEHADRDIVINQLSQP